MTKKIISLLLIALLFTSCALFRRTPDPATHDEGVVINGIRWATRNVDMPGTFAATPESFGMLYQWNRNVAWSATDEEVEDWDSSFPTGTTWYAENDPCPRGWRVPTVEELRSLRSVEHIWKTQNGVNGRLFGIAPNQIFLPAAGNRAAIDGTSSGGVNRVGNYWVSTRYNHQSSWFTWFHSNNVNVSANWGKFGHSIRCVSK